MPVEAERCDLLDRAAAQLRVGGALRDPEEQLAGRALGLTLPRRPERRAAHGLLQLGAGHAGRRADVEAHRDVGAEPPLDRSDELGREARRRAVVDRSERDPVVVDLEQRVPEREDLEAARVGQDRPVPAREPCSPPSSAITSSPGRKCRW